MIETGVFFAGIFVGWFLTFIFYDGRLYEVKKRSTDLSVRVSVLNQEVLDILKRLEYNQAVNNTKETK